jgi:uracil-DNA glycosylase
VARDRWKTFERELRDAAKAVDGPLGENLVLGEGNRNAKVALIGEAPGGQEDRHGRPFVGPAGRMLDELLEAVGLEREHVWVTNVVKLRPFDKKNGKLRNRKPSRQEFDHFLPWLERELKLVGPDVLVSLGATSAKALLGKSSVTMRDVRGEWVTGVLGIDTMVTYHPSFLLRRTGDRDARYEEMRQDLEKVRKRVQA